MTIRPITVCLSLVLLPLILASCGSAPSAVGSNDTGDQTLSTEEAGLLRDLNAARAVARTCGGQAMPAAGAVTWNGYLAKAARAHAQDMAARSYFAHQSPEGQQVEQRAPAAGYTDWKSLGENLIAGETPADMTRKWLESPEHCKGLMSAEFKEVGLAFLNAPGSVYGTYGVQVFGTR